MDNHSVGGASGVSRRRLLAIAGGAGLASVIGGCSTTAPSAGQPHVRSVPTIALQSSAMTSSVTSILAVNKEENKKKI
jgi:hypothetical protein